MHNESKPLTHTIADQLEKKGIASRYGNRHPEQLGIRVIGLQIAPVNPPNPQKSPENGDKKHEGGDTSVTQGGMNMATQIPQSFVPAQTNGSVQHQAQQAPAQAQGQAQPQQAPAQAPLTQEQLQMHVMYMAAQRLQQGEIRIVHSIDAADVAIATGIVVGGVALAWGGYALISYLAAPAGATVVVP